MSCTICGYGFPIADGDAVTLDFKKAKEFLKKHVGSFGKTDEEMQILDALEHAENKYLGLQYRQNGNIHTETVCFLSSDITALLKRNSFAKLNICDMYGNTKDTYTLN